jgi:hypothetical protein
MWREMIICLVLCGVVAGLMFLAEKTSGTRKSLVVSQPPAAAALTMHPSLVNFSLTREVNSSSGAVTVALFFGKVTTMTVLLRISGVVLQTTLMRKSAVNQFVWEAPVDECTPGQYFAEVKVLFEDSTSDADVPVRRECTHYRVATTSAKKKKVRPSFLPHVLDSIRVNWTVSDVKASCRETDYFHWEAYNHILPILEGPHGTSFREFIYGNWTAAGRRALNLPAAYNFSDPVTSASHLNESCFVGDSQTRTIYEGLVATCPACRFTFAEFHGKDYLLGPEKLHPEIKFRARQHEWMNISARCKFVFFNIGHWYAGWPAGRYISPLAYSQILHEHAKDLPKPLPLNMVFLTVNPHPTPWGLYKCPPHQDWRYFHVLQGYASVSKSVMRQYECPVVDMFGLLRHVFDYSRDGSHYYSTNFQHALVPMLVAATVHVRSRLELISLDNKGIVKLRSPGTATRTAAGR